MLQTLNFWSHLLFNSAGFKKNLWYLYGQSAVVPGSCWAHQKKQIPCNSIGGIWLPLLVWDPFQDNGPRLCLLIPVPKLLLIGIFSQDLRHLVLYSRSSWPILQVRLLGAWYYQALTRTVQRGLMADCMIIVQILLVSAWATRSSCSRAYPTARS